MTIKANESCWDAELTVLSTRVETLPPNGEQFLKLTILFAIV